jgi:hypothetical protein
MPDAALREPVAVHSDPEIPIRRGPYPEFTWTAVLLGWTIGA